jgi:hypothetical protein
MRNEAGVTEMKEENDSNVLVAKLGQGTGFHRKRGFYVILLENSLNSPPRLVTVFDSTLLSILTMRRRKYTERESW